eukprot:CAMPEP_0115217286 /NCGR_PEP_ID=MMETSP0270-20121206/25781_1 /TAXON_ID=71861 /ORGANISM="Scrippsiella trochoidea, Strain CCMP3099" /LENGTH=79 /DNA_ID=CAMNT_0002631161 /DNA_START=141 /DNA_END=380 /DNA_ORIENTATION=-
MTSNIRRIMDALAVRDLPSVHGMQTTSFAPDISNAAAELFFELGMIDKMPLMHETQSGTPAMAEALSRPEAPQAASDLA